MSAIHDPAELAHRIQRIEDIEAIKQTKYKYFRCFDTANLEELAETLTEGGVSLLGSLFWNSALICPILPRLNCQIYTISMRSPV